MQTRTYAVHIDISITVINHVRCQYALIAVPEPIETRPQSRVQKLAEE